MVTAPIAALVMQEACCVWGLPDRNIGFMRNIDYMPSRYNISHYIVGNQAFQTCML